MIVSWTAFKEFVTTRSLSIQWVDDGGIYFLRAFDSAFSLECNLDKVNQNPDLLDFEANFKADGNKPIVSKTAVQQTPPFGSKTIVVNGVTYNLFARFTGLRYNVGNGATVLTYTATYPWAKMLGIEITNGQLGDYADLKVYDTAAGTYSGVPNLLLNQFAYTMNVGPNIYSRMAQFDVDIRAGMVIEVTYNSVTLLSKQIGINLLMNEVKL